MHLEVALTLVLATVVILLIAAQLLRIPYPILLLTGGLGLAAAPGIPDVQLEPDLVLVIMLPPLLYSAAFFTPLREMRRNVGPITALAVALVLFTATAVAAVAHYALDFDWDLAFVLGAIVSPTDPVAATAIARRLGVPGRIVTILEGESLINDATALVAYKFAVAAVLTGSFSLLEASWEFVYGVAGGIAVGIAVGTVVAAIRRRLDNPPVEVTIALFSGFFAYLPAEAIGVSGVLAAVTIGIYMGRLTSQLTSPTTRIQGNAVWEIVVFLLNSSLFVLIGLQLPGVLDGIESLGTAELIRDGALIAVTVLVTRIVFTFPVSYLAYLRRRLRHGPDARLPIKSTTVIAWTGMRGAVTLAAALAIPLSTDTGAPFPERDLIIFCAFATILVTLLLQGLSLPLMIRALDLDDRDEILEREEIRARLEAAQAALARIKELVDSDEHDWVRGDSAERLSGGLRYRIQRFEALGSDLERTGDEFDFEENTLAYQLLTREIIEAQRSAVIALRDSGTINDDALRVIERELDLEDARLEI